MYTENNCEDITQDAFIRTKYRIVDIKMDIDVESTLCLVRVVEPGFLTENGYNSGKEENFLKLPGTIEIIQASKLRFI